MPRLAPWVDDHLPEMMRWFPDRRSCEAWGGPRFRYPFTAATFSEDLRHAELPSYSLVGDQEDLVGFGQFYSRIGRCHLARLAIGPRHRRRGHGALLIRELCRVGCERLGVDRCSLFVLAANTPALELYRKLGFVAEPYTGSDLDLDFDEVRYMTASLAEILSNSS